MNVLPKILRRGIIAWCLYGMAQLCMLGNPLMLRLGNFVCRDCDCSQVAHSIGGWIIAIGAAIVIVALFALVHAFSAWLFNEDKDSN